MARGLVVIIGAGVLSSAMAARLHAAHFDVVAADDSVIRHIKELPEPTPIPMGPPPPIPIIRQWYYLEHPRRHRKKGRNRRRW